MNIVNKLTLRHMGSHKGRTLITILGIMVSVAMITAVFVGSASFIRLFGDLSAYNSGNVHLKADDLTVEEAAAIESDEDVASVGYTLNSGDNAVQLTEYVSYRAGTGKMVTGDFEYLTNMVTCKYDGTLPTNTSEIAVEEDFIEKNELDWQIGDTVTLVTGTRYLPGELYGDDIAREYTGSYVTDEFFTTDQQTEFTITAILHENLPTDCPVVRGLSDAEVSAIEGENFDITVNMKEENFDTLNKINQLTEDYGIENYAVNDNLLASYWSFSPNSTVVTSLIPMATIMLVIIVIASVTLIYNAFGMSLSERVRYLGMLSSVGATKRQKRKSVYFESFILGAAGTVLGLLAGITGISITLQLLSAPILDSGMLSGMKNSGITIHTVIPIWALIACVAVSALTVFISSFIPAVKASAITPIDAIKQQSNKKLTAKKMRSSKIVRKLFGYEGELANKSLKRNKRKTNMIVFSITVSIILFLSVNYFCNLLQISMDSGTDVPYQIQVSASYEQREQLLADIEELDGVDDVYAMNSYFYEYGGDATFPIQEGVMEESTLTDSYKHLLDMSVQLYVMFIDDDAFRELCEQNGIDSESYFGSSAKGLLINNIEKDESAPDVFNESVVGAVIRGYESAFYLSNSSGMVIPTTDDSTGVTIGALIPYDSTNKYCNLNILGTLAVLVPESTMYNQMFTTVDPSTVTYTYCIETQDHEALTDELETQIEQGGYTHAYVNDIASTSAVMRTVELILRVLSNGFVILILLITTANIANTISTDIMLRKKEFAMLQSVGMTPKGFRKMISLQSIFYGLYGIIIGMPLSVLLSYCLYTRLTGLLISFSIDILMYLAVAVAVFVIVLISMAYSMHKIKNSSIVETLKEDIL